MIDAGAHHGVLTEVEIIEPEKGAPYMALKFSVYAGVDRTVRLFLSDAARESWVDDQLRDLGFNGNFEEPKFRGDLYTDGIDLWCKHEEYEGKTREKWGISKGEGPAMSGDKLKRLTASWKSKNSSTPRPAGRPPPPAESKAPPAAGLSPLPPAKKKSAEVEWTKDLAWDRWVEVVQDAEKVDTDRWQAEIEKIGDEDKFTAADWKTLAGVAVPF